MSASHANSPADSAAGLVRRLEPWELAGYLQGLGDPAEAEVRWNRQPISLVEALRRAAQLSPAAVVAVGGRDLYVAEADHSPDEGSGPRPTTLVPIQVQRRRGR